MTSSGQSPPGRRAFTNAFFLKPKAGTAQTRAAVTSQRRFLRAGASSTR